MKPRDASRTGGATSSDLDLDLGGDRHLTSLLMRDSLLSEATQRSTETEVVRLLPFAKTVKIGGRSIIDHGRSRVGPLLDEVVGALGTNRLVIGAGAGVRSRHVFGVGLDLGLPTGVLATLAAADAEQNAHMLAALLAPHGVVALPPAQVIHLLPLLLTAGTGVVVNGMPPFELWEHPPALGRIPPNRTDTGMFLLSEVYGVSRVIYVKDVDGLYDADPKLHPEARLIRRIEVAELLSDRPVTLPFDDLVLQLLPHARHCREVQIVNGTEPGELTKALAGEDVGTGIVGG
jgi:molybdenum storage protein